MTHFGVLRSPREIVFGAGQRGALGPLTRRLGARAFICTDERMASGAAFAAMMDNLHACGVNTTVYDRTIAELPLDCVLDCTTAARAFAPDAIIGIGGGSCLDIAKMAALLLTHGGDIRDYYGEFKVPGPVLPLVAVPTTSGTGSEVTPVAVLADPDRTMKVGVSSPHLIPQVAICDPALTYSCPPMLTASTGADALTHAIEAFTALRRPVTSDLVHQHVFIGKNALSDHYALAAIVLIGGSLRRAVKDGSDLPAREDMMRGALYAGLAFGTAGCAAAHAIQYPVGAVTHTPHGVGVALLLPYVMAFNQSVCVHEFAQIATALGVDPAEEARGGEARLAELAVETVTNLVRGVGIPSTLQELGLNEDQQDWTAEQAFSIARLIKNSPRPLALDDVRSLVRAAFAGTLEIRNSELGIQNA